MPNGKMVCFSVETDDGKISNVRITGDFFLHPEDKIDDIEDSLEGLPKDVSEKTAASSIRSALGDAQLIGATPEDFARVFRRAIG